MKEVRNCVSWEDVFFNLSFVLLLLKDYRLLLYTYCCVSFIIFFVIRFCDCQNDAYLFPSIFFIYLFFFSLLSGNILIRRQRVYLLIPIHCIFQSIH